MIKRLRIFILAVIVCSRAAASFGQVGERDSAKISLEEVTITASRIPQNAGQTARPVRIISRREIESSPESDLAGLLRNITDIDVRQRGPIGVQADISLRGGTFDQFAILINGINFSDPQTGHFHLDIPIPLSLIERIEILPGSDVKSLGSNAFSGAINIVTVVPRSSGLHASLQAGQYGLLDAGIDTRLRSGKWWQQSGAVLQKTSGYRENTDCSNLNGFIQSGYSIGRTGLSVMAGGLKKAFGANSFYTPKYPDQFEKTGTGFGAVQMEYAGGINIKESIYYRLHADEFSLFRSDPPAWFTGPNYHLTQTAGTKTDATIETKLGNTALGFEYRHESVWSTVLGEFAATSKPVAGISGVDYTRFGKRDHYSLSLEQQMVTGRFRWNGGVVFHQVRQARSLFRVYPGLDISFAPNALWKAFASVNRAFRLPTFTELYYLSPTNRGNAGLLPESAWHAEAGIEYRTGGFTAGLTGFQRNATQSIDWVRTDSETVWHAENLGNIRTGGVESEIAWLPDRTLAVAKFLDRINLGCRRYFQRHDALSYHSQYVLDYLKWKLNAGFNLRIGDRWRFSADLAWQERNGSYTSFDSAMNMKEVDYKPFMVTDIMLSYRWKMVKLTAACSNLFNRSYFDLGSVPLPGAWYKAGIEINLIGRK